MEKRNTTAAIIKEVFIVAIANIALLAALIIVLRSVGPAILGYKLQNVVWDYSEDPEIVMVCYAGDADETVRRPTVSVIMPPEGQRTFMAILKQSGGRFIRKGLPGEAGSLQIVMRSGEHVSFFTLAEDGTLAVGGENSDNRIYHLDENTTHRVSSVCHTYTGPNSHYPGLTFLQEFFAIDKDDRADFVWPDAPDGVYGGGAVETLHSGIEPYMTEHGFNKLLMERSLYRLEYICKQKGSDWTCSSIDVAPASEPGYYTYRVGLVESASSTSENLQFTGNYYVGEDGLVDNFYVDLD